jgi:hypothetical protein
MTCGAKYFEMGIQRLKEDKCSEVARTELVLLVSIEAGVICHDIV